MSLYRILFVLFILGHLSVFSQTDSIRPHQLQEATVKSYRPSQVLSGLKNNRMEWDMKTLGEMPHLLGAADPLRMAQLLPGIQTNNDFTSGLFMQGCDNAHNRIELDRAPVFNVAHLLGLFSTFNAPHFKKMSLEKSIHNATFGNRLGGLVSFVSDDSLPKKFGLDTEAGLIETQATARVPLTKESGLTLSARLSYINLLYSGLLKLDGSSLNYDFHDLNATYIWKPTSKDHIKISGYYGGDNLRMEEDGYMADNKLKWYNICGSVVWSHFFNKVSWQQYFTYSTYHSRLKMDFNDIVFDLQSAIEQAGYISELSGKMNRLDWKAGISYQYQHTNPQKHRVEGVSNLPLESSPRMDTHEITGYANFQYSFNKKLSVEGGVEGSLFKSPSSWYSSVNPRLTLIRECGKWSRLTLHYGLYHQYLHQFAYSGLGLPVDFWAPVSGDIKPQYAHALTLAFYSQTPDKAYELKVEAYYKRLFHQMEFRGTFFDMLSSLYDWRTSLLEGDGHNYGIDLMLRKNQGRLQGWISYTLGWATRRFPSLGTMSYYPSSHERRHDLTAVATYRLNRRLVLGANFVYASGTPYTRPEQIYIYGQNIVCEYGAPNQFRLPDYHRLDLSLQYLLKRDKGVEQHLNFSIFNAYAHKNVLFMYIQTKGETFRYKEKYSLCRILPSVSYQIKF